MKECCFSLWETLADCRQLQIMEMWFYLAICFPQNKWQWAAGSLFKYKITKILHWQKQMISCERTRGHIFHRDCFASGETKAQVRWSRKNWIRFTTISTNALSRTLSNVQTQERHPPPPLIELLCEWSLAVCISVLASSFVSQFGWESILFIPVRVKCFHYGVLCEH